MHEAARLDHNMQPNSSPDTLLGSSPFGAIRVTTMDTVLASRSNAERYETREPPLEATMSKDRGAQKRETKKPKKDAAKGKKK